MGDAKDVTSSTGADTGSSTAGSGDSSGESDRTGNTGTGPGTDTGADAGIDTTEQVQSTGTEVGQATGRRPGGTGTDDASSQPGNSDGNSTGQPAKRKPGRPRGSRNKPKPDAGESTTGKQASGTVRASVGANKSTAPKRTTRRTKKITGKQVEDGVQKLFGLVSMFRGPHWKVDATEVESWSNDAAELLNKIPSETYERFMNASTIGTVAIGIGGIVVPRAMVDMQAVKMKRMAAELARQEQEQKDAAEGVETVDATPEDRPAPREPNVPTGIFDNVQEGW